MESTNDAAYNNALFTVRSSCGKVMFLHLSVSHSVYRGGCVRGGGVHGRRGLCVAGGMHGRGLCQEGMLGRGSMCGSGWQERRPLQRMVRILLEWILVCF